MIQETAPDPAVRRLLKESNAYEADAQLSALISGQVRPAIERIVRHELIGATGSTAALADDIEDVSAQAVASVIGKITNLRNNPGDSPISDLKGYSARCAYNACGMYLRSRYPVRARVAAQVRSVLRSNDALAAWQGSDGRLVAGRAHWQSSPTKAPTTNERLLEEKPAEAASKLKADLPPNPDKTIDLVVRALDWYGGPMPLAKLIALVMEVRGERDLARAEDLPSTEDADTLVERQASSSAGADAVAELREYLRAVWAEVNLLPKRQAQALLLNFRDSRGNGMLEFLILTSVAGTADIATTLGWSEDELREAWPDLPWEDAKIAKYLGGTTVDVSNLRSVARRRIERRLSN